MPRQRVPITAVLWTTALAVPAALLGLVGVALLDETLPQIALSLSRLNWRALGVESSARWPELAGMIVGQALILVIFLLRREHQHSESS
jgi:hypothetical protein